MPTLLLFAAAREAAGESKIEVSGKQVNDVLDYAVSRFGDRFASILQHSSVFVDGEPAHRESPIDNTSEIAILPPVSGG